MTDNFGDIESGSFQIGIVEFDDGWSVAMRDPDGDLYIFEPTVASEEEARALVTRASATLLEVCHERGLIAFKTDHATGEIIE